MINKKENKNKQNKNMNHETFPQPTKSELSRQIEQENKSRRSRMMRALGRVVFGKESSTYVTFGTSRAVELDEIAAASSPLDHVNSKLEKARSSWRNRAKNRLFKLALGKSAEYFQTDTNRVANLEAIKHDLENDPAHRPTVEITPSPLSSEDYYPTVPTAPAEKRQTVDTTPSRWGEHIPTVDLTPRLPTVEITPHDKAA